MCRRHESEKRAAELIDLVGLSDRSTHFIHQLSGGEQQRTAIARALVHRPALLIADEPTGNLDSHSASSVMRLLEKIAAERLTTLIVVTHSDEVARAASRQVEMRDGKVVRDSGSALVIVLVLLLVIVPRSSASRIDHEQEQRARARARRGDSRT